MIIRPTCSLLAALFPLALSSAAFAEDAATAAPAGSSSLKDCSVCQALDDGAKALDKSFISFDEGQHRDRPPLTPSMIPGGMDERHARDLNGTGTVPTPLLAQDRPFRAVDAYRQYARYQSAGAPATLGGWSAEDWQAYGQEFEKSVLGPDGFDPAQRIRVQQYFVDGPVRFENQQGRQLFDGYNAFISDRATLRTGAFLFTIEPELRLHNTASTGFDPRYDPRFGVVSDYGLDNGNGLYTMEATAQVDIFGAHLTVGQQSLVWGPGYQNNLILSANAAPMWMAHLTTSEPMALPGAASRIGYFSPEAFVAYTGHDRPIPDQLESGVRLGWQVNNYLKLGINLISTFGGKGRSVTADQVIFLGTSGTADMLVNGTQTQRCSWDATVVSPWKSAPFEVYVENGYESRAKWAEIVKLHQGFLNPAWITGFHLPSLDDGGIFSATFEYAWTGPKWYQPNSTPGTDTAYLYQGVPIGTSTGGDAESWFGEVRAKLSHGTELFASESYEQHGLNEAAVVEYLLQTKIGADIDLGRTTGMFRGWHAEPTAEWDNWRNFQGVDGQKEDGIAIGISLRRGF